MSSLSRYNQVLSLPGAKALLAWSLMSRSVNIPLGAIVLITAYGACNNWAAAGIAAALAAGGAAISSWIFGKSMDRLSVRQVMLWTAPGFLTLLGLALLAHGYIEACGWALMSGLTRPATGTGIRSLWASLSQNQETRRLAYAMESGLVPLAGALGAAGSGLIAAGLGARQVGVIATVIAITAAVGLGRSEAAKHCAKQTKPEKPKHRPTLGKGSWAALIAIGSAWIALSAIEVGLGASRGAGQLGLLSACSFASVALGAHIYAVNAGGRKELSWVDLGLLTTAAAGAVLLLGVNMLPLAALGMIILGLSRGIISPASSAALAQYAPRSRQSEAMGLYGSVVLIGQTIGRPLGSLLLHWGASLPMLVACAAGLGAACVVKLIQLELFSKASGSS